MDDKGGYATALFRMPTTLGHTTKTWSQSSSTYYTETNTGRLPKQRNMAQVKEQIKTSEKDLNKMKISNLSDAEFKTLVIRMLKELCEDLSSIKKIQ